MNHSLEPRLPPAPRSGAPRLLYHALIVAAMTVTIFSLLGIASITGHLPSAFAEGSRLAAEQLAPRAPGAGPAASAASGTANTGAPARAATPTHAAVAACADCGVIDAINAIESRSDSGSGLGAVLGGVAGALVGNNVGSGNGRAAMTVIGGGAGAYAGNEIEKRLDRRTVWVTHVRMSDGSVRKVTTTSAPAWAVGARVRIVNGQLVART